MATSDNGDAIPLDEAADAVPLDEAVVLLAPLGQDANVASATLRRAGLLPQITRSIGELTAYIRSGCGSILLTEEALTPQGVIELLAALAEQPSWSDVPLLLLVADDDEARTRPRHRSELLDARNVTILQRPLPAVTLVTALRSALRARRRQYQVRDLLARERLARAQAEEATRIKDQFLATVSHELRTPLSAVLVWAQLLEAGRLQQQQLPEAIRAIACGARAQSKLIEDLLDVSRMLSGKLRLDVCHMCIAPVLSAAAEVVRPMAEAKGVRLDLELEPSSEMVLLDADRGLQIFWNLLSNAVKFTPAGGSISLRLIREPGHVRVQVADTGEGIDADFLPHVFERFRQADSAQTRRHGGLGVGLSIAQQLAELHGGSLDVQSPGRGQGSTFIVRLPLASTGHAPAPDGLAASESGATRAPPNAVVEHGDPECAAKR